MPLNLADFDIDYTITRICGNDTVRHRMEVLGFTSGETVRLLSKFDSNYIVCIKKSKLGISKELLRRVIVEKTHQ